jgi:GNAT superfamily N-acetyltransferase
MKIAIKGPLLVTSSFCNPILDELTDWFGIEKALEGYKAEIDDLPTFLAYENEHIIGFVCFKKHNKYSGEIYIMGIKPAYHRRGIGQMLITTIEDWSKKQGIEFIQVKTLGPSNDDLNYIKTRAFYTAMGYKPLEEIKTIWNEQNPCLIFIKCL